MSSGMDIILISEAEAETTKVPFFLKTGGEQALAHNMKLVDYKSEETYVDLDKIAHPVSPSPYIYSKHCKVLAFSMLTLRYNYALGIMVFRVPYLNVWTPSLDGVF